MTAELLRYAAFIGTGEGGEPAGVVLDAGWLTSPQMVAIARAVGYAATAFVVACRPPAGPDPLEASIRFFGPKGELPGCPGAALGAAIALVERYGPGVLHLSTPGAALRVTADLASGRPVATLTSAPARPGDAATRISGTAHRLPLSPYDS